MKEKLRVLLTLASSVTVVLFLASLAVGAHLFFQMPMNMEILLSEPLESPHPYPATGWEERLALRLPRLALRIAVALEENDALIVEDVSSGAKWIYNSTKPGNKTYVLTDVFYANTSGYVDLRISIVDDGDGETAWGVRVARVITDIWPLRFIPYLIIALVFVPLPPVPAWVLAAFLLALFIALLVVSAVSGGGFHRAVLRGHVRPLSYSLRNFLYAMPFISTALLTGIMGLTWLLERSGIGAAYRGELPGALVFTLEASYAAVVEEVGFRLILIGIPLALAALMKTSGWVEYGERHLFLKALLCPSAISPRLRRELRSIAWALVLITSAVFGVAHVLAGTWEVGKAITASLAGLVMGACFVEYGLHASILLHWFFNYHIQIWWALYELYPHSLSVLLAVNLVFLYELILGALSLLVFLVQGLRLALYRRRAKREQALGLMWGYKRW